MRSNLSMTTMMVVVISMLGTASARATELAAKLNVDNDFALYISTQESGAGTLIGEVVYPPYLWSETKHYTVQLSPGVHNFLLIHARDRGWIAGFLGSFRLSDTSFAFANGTQSLVTNASVGFQATLTGFGGAPVPIVDEGANGVWPWGFRLEQPADSHWIWAGNPYTTDDVYFSIPIDPTTPLITYSWLADGFGACTPSNGICGAGTRIQTVTCMGSDGIPAPGASCSGTPPPTSQACSTQCSPAQLVQIACPPDGTWKNHGAYVSCVAQKTGLLVLQGLLTGAQKGSINSAAGQSSIGK